MTPETQALKIIDVQALELDKQNPEVQIQAFEARQKILKHALETGLRATNARDWTNLGGSPYLQGSGAEKMVPCLPGLEVTDVTETCQEHEDPSGRYYTYTTKGTVRFHSTKLEVIGRASSRDDFFAKDRGRTRSLEEINRNDIAGSAYTDMIRNGIVRMFGLRNLTWEQLEKYGIHRDGVAMVKYEKKAAPPPSAAQDEKPPYWVWAGKEGNQLISAKTGTHFTDAFLKGCGMKQGTNKTIWTAPYNEFLLAKLQDKAEGTYEEKLEALIPPPKEV